MEDWAKRSCKNGSMYINDGVIKCATVDGNHRTQREDVCSDVACVSHISKHDVKLCPPPTESFRNDSRGGELPPHQGGGYSTGIAVAEVARRGVGLLLKFQTSAHVKSTQDPSQQTNQRTKFHSNTTHSGSSA
jgi:hypothetical protein